MGARLNDDETRAWQALLHAHHDVTRRLDAELRSGHGLSLGDYDILLRLANAPSGLSMTDIGGRVLMPASTVTRRMDGLVAAGLVDRRPSATDSRIVLAVITTAGRRLLRRAALTHLRGIRAHFSSRLTAGELIALASALEAIVGSHEAH
jgi:DNA-binding MarR family transcriptional regulator